MTTRVDDELLAGFEGADAERAAKIAELEEKLRERDALTPPAVEAEGEAPSKSEVPGDLIAFHEKVSTLFSADDDDGLFKAVEAAAKIRNALFDIFGRDEIDDEEFDPESFLRKRAEVFDKVAEELGIDSTEDVTTDDLCDKVDMLGAIKTAAEKTFECKPEDAVDKIEELTATREGMKTFLPSLTDLLLHLDKFYPPKYVPPTDDGALTVLLEIFFAAARSADIDWD